MPEEQVPEKEREIVQTQEIPQTNYTYVKTPDGEVIEKEQISQTTGNVTVEQKVKIIMSPLHAKLFLQVAARHCEPTNSDSVKSKVQRECSPLRIHLPPKPEANSPFSNTLLEHHRILDSVQSFEYPVK